jgi:hypothetical protein
VKWLLLACALCTGCDTLFPEFFPDGGSTSDGDGGTDMAGVPHVSGQICVLADLRDWRTCTTLALSGFRVEVEETTDATMTDGTGHFYLLSRVPLSQVTLLVTDPRGTYAETVAPINVSATPDNLGLPVVDSQTLSTLALQNAISVDPTHGSLLGWAIDRQTNPVAGQTTVGSIALYEGAAANQIGPSGSTGAHGTFVIFDQAPPSLALTLTPPDTHSLVPIRAGAVTMTTVVVR